MADGSAIEWTDATWNIVTGCAVHSPGCANCYAMKLAGTRLKHHPSRKGLTQMSKAGPVWTGEMRFNEQWLDQPLRWRRARKIFVCAHGDLFAAGVKRDWQAKIFEVMREGWQHQFQVLTKRPDDMLRFIEECDRGRHHAIYLAPWPMRHVWTGCSIENQEWADRRREPMRALAKMGWRTWVSYEPALGPVDWKGWEFLSWMVSGGESGAGARPTHPDWHRCARDYCKSKCIAYFMKQMDKKTAIPSDLLVREFPHAL